MRMTIVAISPVWSCIGEEWKSCFWISAHHIYLKKSRIWLTFGRSLTRSPGPKTESRGEAGSAFRDCVRVNREIGDLIRRLEQHQYSARNATHGMQYARSQTLFLSQFFHFIPLVHIGNGKSCRRKCTWYAWGS